MQNEAYFFRSGLTYGKRGNLISVQRLGEDHIFTNEGMGVFPVDRETTWSLLGYLNSRLVQYTLNSYAPLHKEVGYVKLLPYRKPGDIEKAQLALASKQYHDLRNAWESGCEICTHFSLPWLLQLARPMSEARKQGLGYIEKSLNAGILSDFSPSDSFTLGQLLDVARAIEDSASTHLIRLQQRVDTLVYDLYNISPSDRTLIEHELSNRPPELVWPRMRGKSDPEKRSDHVRRLFSYYTIKALQADEDGVVPLSGCAAREAYLVDRVRAQIENQFGTETAYNWEQEAAEHLGVPLDEWLNRLFFRKFHVDFYQDRPILWHITSPKGYFAVMLDYRKLSHDTLPKVQSLYLWPQMEGVRTRLAGAQTNGASAKKIADLEEELSDLETCDRRLERVIQGQVEVDLPEWAVGPYRDGVPPYDPCIDDGVKVNLLPIQAAGLLPVKKVV